MSNETVNGEATFSKSKVGWMLAALIACIIIRGFGVAILGMLIQISPRFMCCS